MATDSERRSMLSRSLRFGPDRTVESVANSLIGLHSSDPATVYTSVWARMPDFSVADLETALYERKTLLRILGMRRTMFVIPTGLAGVVHHSSTIDLVAAEQRRTGKMIESSSSSQPKGESSGDDPVEAG